MSESDVLALVAGLGIVLLFVVFICLLILIPVIIAQWKLFKKAGKGGWEALIPIYNTWVLIEISGLHWWYFLVSIGLRFIAGIIPELSFIISLGTLYINFLIYYNIAKKMKQNEILYGILGVFIPVVPILVFGFSKSIQYDKNIQVKPNGVF